ncbi:MAG: MutS-related protein [Rudaea sp.]
MLGMTPDPLRLARQRVLQQQIARLERRFAIAQSASNRISWLRAGTAAAGIVLTYLAVTRVSPAAGAAVLFVAALVFGVVVWYHRGLERWSDAFSIAQELKTDLLARMSLDWESMRSPGPIDLAGKRAVALDLDLTGPRSLHHLLDTTISRRGSQLLIDWLIQPHPDLQAVHDRQAIVRELVPLARFRERFRLAFYRSLRERLEGAGLIEWLRVPVPAERLNWTMPVALAWTLLNLALLVLDLAAGWPPFWLISVVLYFAFYYANQGTFAAFFEALLRVNTELDKLGALLDYLERFSYRHADNLARLCAPFRAPRFSPSARLREVKLITTGIGLRSNLLLGIVLNLLLPWDFVLAVMANRARAGLRDELPAWVDIIHELDALIALGDFAFLNPEYSFPDINLGQSPILQARALGHPLIPIATQVRNDFEIASLGQVDIITGSNMAGKSTFLKTLGVNFCLAYAGAPVDAERFCAAPFRLYTCIRITDSIVDGFSYFYAEVKCLKGLLNELQTPSPLPLLYLIDEMFRGTNNRERLLGSRAYVQSLAGANGCGLISTHDLELATLSDQSPHVLNYHFQDSVADGRLVFDYTIRPGPSPTTNALRIMEMEGLPVDL